MPIAILEDLEQAVEDYPHVYLVLEFVELAFPGNTINKNDDCTFRIQLTNTGPLDVKDLTLLVEGLNDTQVKSNGAAAVFDDSFPLTSTFLGTIPAHNGDSPVVTGGNKFHFKPTKASSTIEDLMKVSVTGWNTDFTHIEINHSRADALAETTFSSIVDRS